MFILANIFTPDQFATAISTITDAEELTNIRKLLLGYQGAHPLRDSTYGFARLLKALNIRAGSLGFACYNWGYRDLKPRQDAAITGLNRGMCRLAQARASVIAKYGELPVGPDPITT